MQAARGSAACLLLLVAGCDMREAGEPSAHSDDLVPCALAGSAQFTRSCAVERVRQGDELQLVIRHQDGGFRRLRVMRDGSGVAALDGADQASVRVGEGEIEVAIGPDRYLLPATVASNGGE